MNTNENSPWANNDTKKLFTYIVCDPDLLLFTIRQFGSFTDHFTDECEQGLKQFFDQMVNKLVITERIDLENIKWSQLIARFLDGYHTQIQEYQDWINSPRVFPWGYDEYEHD